MRKKTNRNFLEYADIKNGDPEGDENKKNVVLGLSKQHDCILKLVTGGNIEDTGDILCERYNGHTTSNCYRLTDDHK